MTSHAYAIRRRQIHIALGTLSALASFGVVTWWHAVGNADNEHLSAVGESLIGAGGQVPKNIARHVAASGRDDEQM